MGKRDRALCCCGCGCGSYNGLIFVESHKVITFKRVEVVFELTLPGFAVEDLGPYGYDREGELRWL